MADAPRAPDDPGPAAPPSPASSPSSPRSFPRSPPFDTAPPGTASTPTPTPAAAAAAAPTAPMPVTGAEYRATAALFGIFVANILLAVLFYSPFSNAGLRAFKNPESVANSLWYLVLILLFTALILFLAKKGHKWLIQAVILFAVGSTIVYVVAPILLLEPLSLSPAAAWTAGLVLAACGTFALWKHPEWYVIDSVGLLVAAGAASIFGISLGILPVLVLLVALAVYDAIAVYKTKHMLALADSVIELRLPVLLVIPKHKGYHFRQEAAKFKQASASNKGEREAMFMGLGDLVMPTILVVSALAFLPVGAQSIDETLTAHPEEMEASGDIPVQLTATPLSSGHSATVQYLISSPDPASATWRWTLDWDADAEADANGTGLPATIDGLYTLPQEILVRAQATAGEGGDAPRGEAAMGVTIATDAGWERPFLELWHNGPALGAALGTLLGFAVLMGFVLRGNPQAGLPLLNGGSILGFLAGLWLETGSIVFW